MTFNNNDDIKNFVKELNQKLIAVGESNLSRELINWENTAFTTTSEFLGELKIILEQIKTKNIPSLKGKTQKNIDSCIKTINKAFGF